MRVEIANEAVSPEPLTVFGMSYIHLSMQRFAQILPYMQQYIYNY